MCAFVYGGKKGISISRRKRHFGSRLQQTLHAVPEYSFFVRRPSRVTYGKWRIVRSENVFVTPKAPPYCRCRMARDCHGTTGRNYSSERRATSGPTSTRTDVRLSGPPGSSISVPRCRLFLLVRSSSADKYRAVRLFAHEVPSLETRHLPATLFTKRSCRRGQRVGAPKAGRVIDVCPPNSYPITFCRP